MRATFPAPPMPFDVDKAVVDGQLVVVPGLHARRVQERTVF